MTCDRPWPVIAQVTAHTEVWDDSQGQAGYDPMTLKSVCSAFRQLHYATTGIKIQEKQQENGQKNAFYVMNDLFL